MELLIKLLPAPILKALVVIGAVLVGLVAVIHSAKLLVLALLKFLEAIPGDQLEKPIAGLAIILEKIEAGASKIADLLKKVLGGK